MSAMDKAKAFIREDLPPGRAVIYNVLKRYFDLLTTIEQLEARVIELEETIINEGI
jgi:hypothetical protein